MAGRLSDRLARLEAVQMPRAAYRTLIAEGLEGDAYQQWREAQMRALPPNTVPIFVQITDAAE